MVKHMVRTMAKGRGRPPKPEDEVNRGVRLNKDLADMIGWIVRLQGGTAAQLCDPLLRPQITKRYKDIEPEVERVKKAASNAKKKAEAQPES